MKSQPITHAKYADSPDLREVSAFLAHEARLLDDRLFEEWMALFVDTGVYWAPATINQSSPLSEVSIFFDDVKLIAQRINRLRHERIHVQSPHSRSVHIVENALIEEISPETNQIIISSKFIMVEYRPSVPEGLQRIFAGNYRHTLIRHDSTFRIIEKKATLINCDSAFAPLALYF